MKVKLEVGVDRPGSCCTLRPMTCYRVESPRHEHRRSKPTAAKNDEQGRVAAAAAVAVGARDRGKVDPVSGKELIDTKSQKMQVRLGQAL